MVASKRSREATPDAGSCRLLTRGDGDHNGEVLGADGGPAPSLCAGNDTGDGSWIRRLLLVRPTESERSCVYYTNEEGHCVRGCRISSDCAGQRDCLGWADSIDRKAESETISGDTPVGDHRDGGR